MVGFHRHDSLFPHPMARSLFPFTVLSIKWMTCVHMTGSTPVKN